MRNLASCTWRIVVLLAAGLLLAAGAAACDGDDEPTAEELQEVEDVVAGTVGASGADAEYFFAHVTDNIIETVLFSSRDECEANADECIGEPLEIESISGTTIDGDRASATVDTGFIGAFDVGLVRRDGVWMLDTFQAASDDVPDGVPMIEMGVAEFAFIYDAEEIPSDGNFALRIDNRGNQIHEVVIISIAEGQDVEAATEAVFAEEVPPAALKVFIVPGQELDMALPEPLAPGNYAFICFLPDTDDPEFAPHFEKGMVSEFSVQ